jgi:membrane protein DedA with SNARE-associated domain
MPLMKPPVLSNGEPMPELAPSPAVRRFVLALSALLFAVGTFGSNIGPAWIDDRPAVVLALSARNRNLLFSVPYIDPLPFAVIGFCRVLVAGVALFFLGRYFGSRAISWTEGQVGELPVMYSWFQRAVDKAGWLMLLLMPGSNLVCMMAGYRRMKPSTFLAFISVGITAKLAVLWAAGKAFEDQLTSFLDAIEKYQWYIVGGLFAITFLQSARKAKKNMPDVLHELDHPEN